ncbi:MAG: hypothetical protein V4489_06280, partial [Chlamydiota bacterium]
HHPKPSLGSLPQVYEQLPSQEPSYDEFNIKPEWIVQKFETEFKKMLENNLTLVNDIIKKENPHFTITLSSESDWLSITVDEKTAT